MRTKKARSKGSGTLYKCGGRWYGKFTLNGRRHTVSTNCTVREEAEKFLLRYLTPFRASNNKAKLEHIAAEIRLLDADIVEARRRANDYAIDGMPHMVYMRRELSDSTKRDYRIAFAMFGKFLAERHPDVCRMSQVSRAIALEFRDELASGRLHPMTANGYIKTIKAAWNTLADEDNPNPWRKIMIRGRSTPRGDLTDVEFEAVMDAARRNGGDIQYLFELASLTGMRLSDCCLLRWETIDIARRVITFVPKKLAYCGKTTRLPMSQRVFDLISSRTGGRSGGYVCPKLSKLYATWNITHYVRRIFAAAGIPPRANKSFHSLRVHAITRLLENGIPLATVQAIAGHASPEMTQHYYRMDIDRTRAMLDGLERRAEGLPMACRADTITITAEEYYRLKAYESLLRSAAVERLAPTKPPPALPAP